jgi:hypothetical protein
MAMNAFLLLNCFGLVFLMYTLANFWNEWRQHKNGSHREVPLDKRIVGDRIEILPQVFLYPQTMAPIIQFPARDRQIDTASEHQKAAATTIELSVVRTRTASRAGK